MACVESSAQVGNQVQSLGMTNRGGMISGSMTVSGPGLLLMRPILGQPYSAEQESEHSQTLANGTHIQQKRDLAKMYRDSQGRTRTERMLFAGALAPERGKEPVASVVHIYDPVEGYSYTLDTQKHTAHRFAVSLPETASPNVLRAPGTTRVLTPVEAASKLPSRSKVREGRQVKQEPLGTGMIEGVQAGGTRITMTTPTGAQGNDRPLVHVCERWHSAELDLTLLSNCSDPRFGHTTMRRINLDRGEPDPALFQVPPDYIIVDEKDRFTMEFREPQSLAVGVSVVP
jgi:hypothetical protein